MDARLKVLSGPFSGQTIQIPSGKLILGREEDCHLQLSSPVVSRHHCVLLLDEYTLRIRDLGSKNGTFVNSRRIGTGVTVLQAGDVVSIGDMICEIELAPATPGSQPRVPDVQPAVPPSELQGTGVFDGDTVQTDKLPVVPPLPSTPARVPTPIIAIPFPTQSDGDKSDK